MSNIVKGGQTVYGYDIGVLMLDSTFPRIIGDVGNARTWDYPVLYKKVVGYKPHNVVLELTDEDIQPFIDAAIELKEMGVKAITTSCGFLALFQKKMAEAVGIPIFTSSLIMLPMICRMNANKPVLVLTANSDTLSQRHIDSVCGNLSDCKYDVVGTQHTRAFTDFTVHNWSEVDTDICREDILETVKNAIDSAKEPYGSILLECTNMPPYSDDIRELTGLPVFDFVTLMNFVHSSVDFNDFGKVRL